MNNRKLTIAKELCQQYQDNSHLAIKIIEESLIIAANLAYLTVCEEEDIDPYNKGRGLAHRFYDPEIILNDLRLRSKNLVKLHEQNGTHTVSSFNNRWTNTELNHKIEVSLCRINGTAEKKIIWINSFRNNDKLYVLNEVKNSIDPEIEECFIMWESTDDNPDSQDNRPIRHILSYDDRKDKQITEPFGDEEFMQPYMEDEMEELIEAMYLHAND